MTLKSVYSVPILTGGQSNSSKDSSVFSNFYGQVDVTADWTGAGSAFLGKQVTEAVEAVDKVVPRRKALASQLALAADAHEAFLVPGLVPVIHAACGDGLKKG